MTEDQEGHRTVFEEKGYVEAGSGYNPDVFINFPAGSISGVG